MRISDWSSDVCSSDLDTPLSIRSRPCSHPPNALSISPFPRAPTGAGERPRDSGASPLPPEAPRRLVDATHQPQMAPVTPDRPKRRSHPAVRIALLVIGTLLILSTPIVGPLPGPGDRKRTPLNSSP